MLPSYLLRESKKFLIRRRKKSARGMPVRQLKNVQNVKGLINGPFYDVIRVYHLYSLIKVVRGRLTLFCSTF